MRMIIPTIVCVLLSFNFVWATELGSIVDEANRQYSEGNFERATSLYRKAYSQGITNGHLLYNMGNAHYRLGEYGHAIANYRRAAQQLSGNHDVEENLRLARKQVVDELTSLPNDNLATGNFNPFLLNRYVSQHSLQVLGLTLYALFCLATLFHFTVRRDKSRVLCILLGVPALWLILSGFCVRLDANNQYVFAAAPFSEPPRAGVIVAEKVKVFSGDAETFQTIFVLHDGAEVSVSKQRNSWVQIILPDKRRGWVKQNHVEII